MLHLLKYSCLSTSKLNKDYLEATDWLFSQFPSYQKIGSKAYKPTIDNIQELVQQIGNPQDNLKFIHVAGSNGKGSTCSMLASILTSSNYKVGLFTSPHIQNYTERIRVNGIEINQKIVVEFVNRIKLLNLSFSPSFFEVTFALALYHFNREAVDICVIETGLGGRLDATNIITPEISVITNISFEHTQILGDTIEKIAKEKAGIIKPNVPIVLGNMDPIALKTIQTIAKDKKASVILAEKISHHDFTSPLLGEYQEENLRTALSTINTLQKLSFDIVASDIQIGLQNLVKNTGFMGRLQVVSKNPLIIFDVSHNPEGIKASMKYLLKINQGKLRIIFGTSSDKDLTTISHVLPNDATYYFTTFNSERSTQISDFKSITNKEKFLDSYFFNDPKKALKQAKHDYNEKDTIVAIGSFFLIADFF